MNTVKLQAFLLAFLILLSLVIVPGLASAASVNQVRVLLTDYKNLQELELGIYGNYTLNDALSFQRGSKLNISLVQGNFQVRYEGLVYLAGPNIRLKRHQEDASQENGLRLQAQLNLYPGDLHLSVESGVIQPVLTLPVEDYLQGVVPYEMADDFPLEALKAQAVAARTYTLKNLKPGKPYDLVDNTNDQVFRGIHTGKTNAIQAVRDTSGMVCEFQGQLASCFYTASNGGYTESAFNAWGREQIPYLGIVKDVYDLDNPASIVKTALISKDMQQPANAASSLLAELLKTRLVQKQNSFLSDADQEHWQLMKIKGISAHTPKYGGEAGVMKMLRFDVELLIEGPAPSDGDSEVSLGGQQDNQKTDGPSGQMQAMVKTLKTVSLDVPIFPDIEQALSLSINRSENEIVHLTEEENSFTIQFRRYGHGVGMSQRGAEQMARKHHWNYEQILRFYYPGTQLSHRDTQPAALPAFSQQYLATPGPSPTATPRPTLMPQSLKPEGSQYLVYVSGVKEDSSLNLRQKPDYLAEIITRLYYGQELLVLHQTEDGWLEVQTDDARGFIRHEYVGREKPAKK